jgi:hypothetical protein
MQQLRPAIDTFLGVLKVNGENVIAHETLGRLFHANGDGWLAIYHSRKAEAIYSKMFGPNYRNAVILRQNLEVYYKEHFLRPEDFATES